MTKKTSLIIIILLVLAAISAFIYLKTRQQNQPILSFTPAYKVADASMRTWILMDTNGSAVRELDLSLKYQAKNMQLIDRDDLAKGTQFPMKSEMGDIKNLSLDEERGLISFSVISSGETKGKNVKVAALDFILRDDSKINFVCNKNKALLSQNPKRKSSVKCLSKTLTLAP